MRDTGYYCYVANIRKQFALYRTLKKCHRHIYGCVYLLLYYDFKLLNLFDRRANTGY